MSQTRPTCLIVVGILAAALLAGVAVLAIALSGRVAGDSARHDAPLLYRADSIFVAEHGHGTDLQLGAALSAAELRRLRLLSLPARVLLAPVAGVAGVATWFVGGDQAAAAARLNVKLTRLRLEAGQVSPAARAASRAGYWYLMADLPQNDSAVLMLRLAYGLHRLAGNDAEAALALEHLAARGTTRTEYDSSDTLLLDALAIYRRVDDGEPVSRVLVSLGCNRQSAEEPASAVRRYLDALNHAREHSLPDGLPLSYLNALQSQVCDSEFTAMCHPLLDETAARSLLAELRARAATVEPADTAVSGG